MTDLLQQDQLAATIAPTAARRVPFHVPDIDEDDVAAVVDVLRSGWLTTGPACSAFEQAFAEHLGGGVQAIAVNSCTSALHLALEALGVGPGDLVLTTPYTFTATAEVVRYLGADPVFADVDPRSGNLEAATIGRAVAALPGDVRRRIKVLLPVHFGGLPCDMAALTGLAARHGWSVLDDAAHALPATHAGLPIGRWGDISAFSFYATKTLCTGEGGMVVTSRADLAERIRVMRLHGISRDAFDRYRVADGWRYEVVAAGFKYNLTDLAAALGLSQLRRVEEMRARRRAIARTYTEALRGVDGLAVPPDAAPHDDHAWHLYALRVTDGATVRDRFVRELDVEGVTASVHFIPLHLQPYYRDAYGLDPDDFPGATELYGQEVSLPLFPGMTADQVEHVLAAVLTAIERARR